MKALIVLTFILICGCEPQIEQPFSLVCNGKEVMSGKGRVFIDTYEGLYITIDYAKMYRIKGGESCVLIR